MTRQLPKWWRISHSLDMESNFTGLILQYGDNSQTHSACASPCLFVFSNTFVINWKPMQHCHNSNYVVLVWILATACCTRRLCGHHRRPESSTLLDRPPALASCHKGINYSLWTSHGWNQLGFSQYCREGGMQNGNRNRTFGPMR